MRYLFCFFIALFSVNSFAEGTLTVVSTPGDTDIVACVLNALTGRTKCVNSDLVSAEDDSFVGPPLPGSQVSSGQFSFSLASGKYIPFIKRISNSSRTYASSDFSLATAPSYFVRDGRDSVVKIPVSNSLSVDCIQDDGVSPIITVTGSGFGSDPKYKPKLFMAGYETSSIESFFDNTISFKRRSGYSLTPFLVGTRNGGVSNVAHLCEGS